MEVILEIEIKCMTRLIRPSLMDSLARLGIGS